MKLNILCLDDVVTEVRKPFDAVAKSLPGSDEIPFFRAGERVSFTLRRANADPLDVTLTLSEGTNPRGALDKISADARFDLVLVDDNWGTHGETAGQELFPDVLAKVKGEYSSLPMAVLFTIHWGDQPARVQSFCDVMDACARDKSRVITGLGKDDSSGLLVLIQSVAILKQMAAQQATTTELLSQSQQLAHSNSPLVSALRSKLFGIDNVLLELAKIIEPFGRWKNGEYTNLPNNLRPTFASAILLEGEPGAGKTTICDAIASTLSSPSAVLPKSLGPGSEAKRWKTDLEAQIKKFYGKASNGQVVVIRADDLAWPAPKVIADGALSADWQQYLYTLRDCIEDAARINNDMPPEGLVKELGIHPEGKILWLFARNENDDIGEMFGPLKNKLRGPYPLKFPRDEITRRGMLVFKAARSDCTFEPDALTRALQGTHSFLGRHLIGDDTGEKGFLPFVISRVKERERTRWSSDNQCKPAMIITKKEVEEWFASYEHAGIIGELDKHGSGGKRHDSNALAMPNLTPKPNPKNRACAEGHLNRWEEACRQLVDKKEGSPTSIDRPKLAKAMRISQSAVTQVLGKYKSEMKTMLATQPDTWPILAQTTELFK